MTSLVKQAQDWYLKSLQVNRCYKKDWTYIKSVYVTYGLDLNEHSPILTMNELKNVRAAESLTNKICNYPEFENYTSGQIFLCLQRAMPIYNRIYANNTFETMVCLQKPPLLHQLIAIDGTIKDSDVSFEKIVHKVAQII